MAVPTGLQPTGDRKLPATGGMGPRQNGPSNYPHHKPGVISGIGVQDRAVHEGEFRRWRADRLFKDLVPKDLLYGISHRLYTLKAPLEQHLSRRTNELFDLEDKIILYDLTNTYFEGRMAGSKIAKFGRSKEKRNNARIVVLAMVINRAS